MAELPKFMEGPGGKDEAIGKAATTLLEASDFQQFRDMMLFTKCEFPVEFLHEILFFITTKTADVNSNFTFVQRTDPRAQRPAHACTSQSRFKA